MLLKKQKGASNRGASENRVDTGSRSMNEVRDHHQASWPFLVHRIKFPNLPNPLSFGHHQINTAIPAQAKYIQINPYMQFRANRHKGSVRPIFEYIDDVQAYKTGRLRPDKGRGHRQRAGAL